ncbi:MAG: hypothetical protein IKE05_02470, partial [Clostridia bacterium]|nr:hypothetical protein [Clostridia bacterium]
YYFVTGIKSVRDNLWEVSCDVDVLGTYKATIQATSAHIVYYTHSNSEISDRRLSTKTTKSLSIQEGVFDTLGSGTGTNYAVVLNVVAENVCGAYAVDQDDAATILSDLTNWIDDDNDGAELHGDPDDPVYSWLSIEESIKSFFQGIEFFIKQWFASGKVSDNLKSAYIMPLPVSAFSGNTDNVYLGKYKSEVEGVKIYDRIFSDGCSVTIPWQASDWRRNAPYHELYLYIPYVGLIALSPSDLIGDTTINVSVSIDVTCGDAIFTVYTGTKRFIGQYTANMAAPFAIGTSNVQVTQQVNTLIAASAAAAGAIASGGTALAIGAVSGGAVSLANNIGGHPSCIGSNMGGAVLGLRDKVVCYSVFHDTSVAPASVSQIIGTPYNGVMSLSGISGYVQTSAASVAGTMTDTEREQINQMLDGGIYIE